MIFVESVKIEEAIRIFIYIVGTKTNFNFGSYVCEQTMKHDPYFALKMHIALLSLICGVILSKHPGMLISYDVPCKRESLLTLHYRLFRGTHVPDIVVTSTYEADISTSRKRIIA